MGDATGAPTVVIGTAGHIDHGKTTLLRALTGIDADRLPEEQARGMTIDVGYAHLTFDDGVELDFVDVPGHDRLIGNMLVAAGEIDAAMLVVAADDGPRPQTLEHLQLLDALGISAGLAVVTKIDMVEPGRVAEVVAAVAALLSGTSLAGAPVLSMSSVSGEGIEALRLAIRTVRDMVAARQASGGGGPLRLAIDRAFAVKGRGAVVTGTLRGGSLAAGTTVRREPGGEAARVREIQVHNRQRDSHDGGRTAVNVAGLPVERLRRGDVLTAGPGILATDRLLVVLRSGAKRGDIDARTPRARATIRLHVGTDQVDATMRRVAARQDVAILTLERQTATFAGDRAVLREPASGAVVAGIRVLDVHPVRGVSRRRLTAEHLDRLVGAIEAGQAAEIEAAQVDLHGAAPSESGYAFATDVRDALEAAAIEAVAIHHREGPLSAGLPLPRARATLLRRLHSVASVERRDSGKARDAVAGVIDDLVARGTLARTGEALRDPSRGSALPAALLASMDRLEVALSVAAPPPLDEAAAAAGCPPDGVRTLAAEGRIVRLGPDLAWATPTYHRLAALALEQARFAPLTPAAYRDATGTSRKYVMAILEDLDRRGILERTPDGHIPGPRAPRATAS
ncbi:MAG: selenocysteine-specific translation elongation factor [Candidatus Limnocylindrales bacterium]